MRILDRLRQAVHDQHYRMSAHANEEMSDDSLEAQDVENILLRGKIVRRFARDPRGTRYEVAGVAADGRRAFVVCRFLLSRVLLIITAYREEDEQWPRS
jgi:hypothetical protein